MVKIRACVAGWLSVLGVWDIRVLTGSLMTKSLHLPPSWYLSQHQMHLACFL